MELGTAVKAGVIVVVAFLLAMLFFKFMFTIF